VSTRPFDWRFWLSTLAALVGAGVTLSLGLWQLSRAAQKEALRAGIESQRQQPPVPGHAFLGLVGDSAANPGGLIHRRVVLQGSWLGQHTVFLDNRQMNGKPGFYVLTPLQLADSRAVLLVQRGWVPRNFVDRNALPDIQTPAGMVGLQGRIAPEPAKLYAFEGPDTGVIRQNLGLAAFRQETGLPLLDVTVVQTGDPSEGLQRQWPDPASGVDKHHGYAFQWFGLSGLIAILYVWFQIVRRFRSPPSA
jgi:surfeit locus 1 family protein